MSGTSGDDPPTMLHLVSRVGSSVTNSTACGSTPAGAGLRREPASLAPAPPPGYPAQTPGVGASRRGTWTGRHFAGFSPRRRPIAEPSRNGFPAGWPGTRPAWVGCGPACSGCCHRPWICSGISDSGHYDYASKEGRNLVDISSLLLIMNPGPRMNNVGTAMTPVSHSSGLFGVCEENPPHRSPPPRWGEGWGGGR